MDSLTVQLNQRGVIVIPKTLREAYNLKPGDQMTLLNLDGVFVLSPKGSEIDYLADQIKREILEQGESLESMLAALREIREEYE